MDQKKLILGMKLASSYEEPEHPAKTLGKGILGFGTGMLGSYLGLKGIDALMKRNGGTGIPQSFVAKALPIVGGLGGLAYTQMHNAMLDKMRRDHINRQEAKRERKDS